MPHGAEPLAGIDYATELNIKRAALEHFARQHKLPLPFSEIVASPLPRNYRTTTKRRVILRPLGVTLTFGDESQTAGKSLLEPLAHGIIYEELQKVLRKPSARKFADSLTHIIIRGSYTEFSVVFNVGRRSAALSALLSDAAKAAAAKVPQLTSALEFLDETRSDYYLDTDAKAARGAWKRLFGGGYFSVPAGKITFRVSAKVFSQVNQSMLPVLTEAVGKLLHPDGNPLVDLYCGYGLFALTFAAEAGRVTAIETDPDAVKCGIENAGKSEIKNVRFYRQFVSDDSFEGLLPYGRTGEIVILDPPRQGTEKGVISAIASRKPLRVAHIFCAIDELPRGIAEWNNEGYEPHYIIPFDMFAGTPAMETVVIFGEKEKPKT